MKRTTTCMQIHLMLHCCMHLCVLCNEHACIFIYVLCNAYAQPCMELPAMAFMEAALYVGHGGTLSSETKWNIRGHSVRPPWRRGLIFLICVDIFILTTTIY